MEDFVTNLSKDALKDIVEYANLDPKLKDNAALIGYIERNMRRAMRGIR